MIRWTIKHREKNFEKISYNHVKQRTDMSDMKTLSTLTLQLDSEVFI